MQSSHQTIAPCIELNFFHQWVRRGNKIPGCPWWFFLIPLKKSANLELSLKLSSHPTFKAKMQNIHKMMKVQNMHEMPQICLQKSVSTFWSIQCHLPWILCNIDFFGKRTIEPSDLVRMLKIWNFSTVKAWLHYAREALAASILLRWIVVSEEKIQKLQKSPRVRKT